MSPLMTEDLLSRIKEALERATPGRWIAETHAHGIPTVRGIGKTICSFPGASTSPARAINDANAAYIALLSPENVRALIGEVERLQTEVLNAAFSDRLDMEAGGSPLTWKEVALAAEREVERLREALEKGAEWFEEYADHHQGKGALDKASRNLERANYLRRARQSLQGSGE